MNSIQGSVLVDGLFAAWWNLRRPSKDVANLEVRPFWRWGDDDQAAVDAEARRLLAWVAPGDGGHDVDIVQPG